MKSRWVVVRHQEEAPAPACGNAHAAPEVHLGLVMPLAAPQCGFSRGLHNRWADFPVAYRPDGSYCNFTTATRMAMRYCNRKGFFQTVVFFAELVKSVPRAPGAAAADVAGFHSKRPKKVPYEPRLPCLLTAHNPGH